MECLGGTHRTQRYVVFYSIFPILVLPDTFLEVMRAVNGESRLALLIHSDLQAEFTNSVHRPATQYTQCAQEFPEEFLTILDKVVDGLQWGYYRIGMGDPNAGTYK